MSEQHEKNLEVARLLEQWEREDENDDPAIWEEFDRWLEEERRGCPGTKPTKEGQG